MEVFSSGHETELEDCASLTVMMPRHGHIEVCCGTRMESATIGGAVSIGPSLRKTRVHPPGDRLFDACQLNIPVLHPLAEDCLGRVNADDVPFVRANEDAVPALSELVSYVLTDLASDAPILTTRRAALQLDTLVDEHIRRLFETEQQAAPDGGDESSARLVRTAEEFMRINHHEPLHVADIARAAGVSARRLQVAFKVVTDQTPWHRLTAIRLEQARLRLLARSANDSVSGIALDCGFTHLGRFSALYRATYHEAPSETLRRSRM